MSIALSGTVVFVCGNVLRGESYGCWFAAEHCVSLRSRYGSGKRAGEEGSGFELQERPWHRLGLVLAAAFSGCPRSSYVPRPYVGSKPAGKGRGSAHNSTFRTSHNSNNVKVSTMFFMTPTTLYTLSTPQQHSITQTLINAQTTRHVVFAFCDQGYV